MRRASPLAVAKPHAAPAPTFSRERRVVAKGSLAPPRLNVSYLWQ